MQAEVIGVWIGSEKVLLRAADDPEAFEATAPPAVARHLGPGTRVTIFRGTDGRVLGWYLPERHIGVREDMPGDA